MKLEVGRFTTLLLSQTGSEFARDLKLVQHPEGREKSKLGKNFRDPLENDENLLPNANRYRLLCCLAALHCNAALLPGI